MKRLPLVLLALGLMQASLLGCMNREPAPVCPVPTELNKTNPSIGGFEGVDMLVVVDNSGSMAEEQEILATSFFPLINSLVNPLPDWKFDSTDNMRVAIVTSDMGLSWGEAPNAFSADDGWPASRIPATCINKNKMGDEGKFQSKYSSTNSINIVSGVIKCDDSASQCPTGWTCENIIDEIGVCVAPGGNGNNQTCPASPDDLNMQWSELSSKHTDTNLAFTTACMANLGTKGCGIEQQLQSAAIALNDPDQHDFIRDTALLVVLVVSDEEDCSIKDGKGLFASDEIQNGTEVNIACGMNPEFLFPTSISSQGSNYFRQRFEDAKEIPGSVLFAAIVGVPMAGEGEGNCEGKGTDIGSCLANENMELKKTTKELSGTEYAVFELACERLDSDDKPVTQAYPGRRYVELAQDYASMSYIYSICNEDWSSAMEDIAELIASNLTGTCYDKKLDWDMATKEAKCDVVVDFRNADSCPEGFEWAGEPETTEEEVGETMVTTVSCRIPRIKMSLDCAATSAKDLKDINNDQFGWYYCERYGENFTDACADGVDNDDDGNIDCDDDECKECAKECGGSGDPVACPSACRYMVQLTASALQQATVAQGVSVQCIQQFSFEDPNCQENTRISCNDGVDNDGNGPFDCRTTEETVVDKNGIEVLAHIADQHCCPMTVDDDNNCVIDSSVDEICGTTKEADRRELGACIEARSALKCN